MSPYDITEKYIFELFPYSGTSYIRGVYVCEPPEICRFRGFLLSH